MKKHTYNYVNCYKSAGLCKYSLCFVKILLTRSYVCPLRELAVPTGQWVTLLSCLPNCLRVQSKQFFYGLTTIEVYCNFRVAGVNIFYRIYYKSLSLYNDHLYFIHTIFIKTQGGYLSLNVISNDFYKFFFFSLTLNIL